MRNRLVVKGARQHNLRDVSVELPGDALIVFTGVPGSGKSSLAFDTIFAEGRRRYAESLSAYAGQFRGQLDKPDVDAVEGLSPDDAGLGCVSFGRPAPAPSGGEAQRVKLAAELQCRTRGRTLYALDEPPTGLHAADIERLLLHRGQEGGHRGARVVAEGPPERGAAEPRSHPGRFLNSLLEPA